MSSNTSHLKGQSQLGKWSFVISCLLCGFDVMASIIFNGTSLIGLLGFFLLPICAIGSLYRWTEDRDQYKKSLERFI